MKVKLKPISVIKADLGINPDGPVQAFFTDTCDKRMDKYVPWGDTGNLKDTKTKTIHSITYEMPYAHYQYIGISHSGKTMKHRTDKNPLATSNWDKKMWSAEKDIIIKEVQEYVNRGR